jgi:hypothetical protein
LLNPGAEKIGSQWIVSVPLTRDLYETPPGMRELKMSEYWSLKEAA